MGTATKSVVVNAPVSQVYNFWRNFENFPRFMENIESIHVTGEDLSHWKSKGPLGTTVEWEAKTTSVQENKKISWQSVEGTIETHGAVTFEETGNGTKITVGLEYTPPAGIIGETVAKIFSDPEKQLEEDLERFKKVAESGEFAQLAAGDTPAVGEGSYTNTASSAQRKDIEGEVVGSGSGDDENSGTRSTS